MQNTKLISQSNPSPAFAMLEKGLQDLQREPLSTKELELIGKRAGNVSAATCKRYISELAIGDFETGKNILVAARKYIIEREQSITQLVSIA